MRTIISALTGFLSLVAGTNMVCATVAANSASTPGGNSGNSSAQDRALTSVSSTDVTKLDNQSSNIVVWIDDSLPSGATGGSDGGDTWNWVNSNPTPFAGSLAHQSSLSAGLHQHYFLAGNQPLSIGVGDNLFTYVYLDPNNPPSEIMLQWNDGSSWEHRAYWGANNITYGTVSTPGRVYMGPLPATGQWVLLQVPANQLALEGSSISGMAFSQYDGRATWDYTGKAAGGAIVGGPPANGGTNSTSGSTFTNSVVWFDDSLPSGAAPGADGNDSWNWVSSNPAPFSGRTSHQSNLGAGLHEHFFTWATSTMQVNTGDVLFAAVYLDPNNLPSEIMLQWNDGSWDHRAYWGANNISYGTSGTAERTYMGALPAAGQWVLLQVPADRVALEGQTVSGMAFSQNDGRVTWDYVGKASSTNLVSPPSDNGGTNTTGNGTGTGTGTNTNGTGTSTGGTGTTNTPPDTTTNTPPTTTNSVPGVSRLDYVTPELPQVGDTALHVLTPTLLELKRITTKQPDPAQLTEWNFVNSNFQLNAPPPGAFAVTANGQTVAVTAVGFKRRPVSAPMIGYDLRIENSLYLQLAAPVSDNQVIEVKNPDGSVWAASTQFAATVDPLRYSPAIHVNQEGYMPNYSKKAMVGYYAGSMSEMTVPVSAGFKIVDATTGAQVYQGSLSQRTDFGYTYNPKPYQKVYEADFTSFNTPGEYRLVVPGMGGSLPFLIHDGVAMDFARAYALGLYHQRCGTNTAMPHTRFTHDTCHAAPASVPASDSSYPFTWTTVAGYANTLNQNNPPQVAPALTSPGAQLFPFVNQQSLDVSGGHHDAGDYSKYTINSASLVHYLMFAVDSLPGVAALDNLGIPESGDGISDVMQEAKWEADFLAKMQDSDGGFYFLVYPQNREYEGNVTPDHGDPQVVWPKTTSVTAASVAALAQCASSPLFKQTYPAAAANYLQKAKLGWQFLMNAVQKYGKNGAYQKITHYGDNFADNDEMAWAACQMYLATGDPSIHQLLLNWFDPADPTTWRWGWWHMSECYGHAIRSYAFAVQSGRMSAGQLDSTFLTKCQAQVTAAADDMVSFSQQNAYGTSFPFNTKAVQSAGWYFSTDQAFDLAVAYQLNAKGSYMDAMMANMNYEGGCNPVNVTYVTGLGWKRQRDIVSQWALNDTRVLPPSGIPVGNIQGTFGYLWNYAGTLEALCFPSDDSGNTPYPFYDRWGDSWNVTTEMVVLNQARSIGTLTFLAAQSAYKTQPWRAPANAQITVPTSVVPVAAPVTVTLQVPGMDLSGARVTWEARDQEPAFGASYTFSPKNNGVQWVEAEAQWPDGRRAFAKASFSANSPNIVWVDDALPAGATPGADGGDSWSWVNSNPTPVSGSLEHRSAAAAGSHQHYFDNATATLTIGTGDVLYAYVYLDPINPPSEVMLQWSDGTWAHRAYWGADNLSYGIGGTVSRHYMGPLPPVGQWVQLKVPASEVGLEGSTLNGMGFTLYGGSAMWDAAGRLSSVSTANGSTVTVNATVGLASRTTAQPGLVTFTRDGDTSTNLVVNYTLGGDAKAGVDYTVSPPSSSVTIPAGARSTTLNIVPQAATNFVFGRSLSVSVASAAGYAVGTPSSATVSVSGNTIPATLRPSPTGATLTWPSSPSHVYQVAYKDHLTDASWTTAGQLTAAGNTTVWTDPAAPASGRFYVVAEMN